MRSAANEDQQKQKQNPATLGKDLTYKCLTCRRLHGATGQHKMPDLPRKRVIPHEPPVMRTEVDYLGPIEVKCEKATVK